MRGTNPCWHCRYWSRWVIGYYTHGPGRYAGAVCSRFGGVAEPQFGCAYWEREVGSDDEERCVDPTGRVWRPGSL